jgi:nucleoporin POM152
LSNKEIKTLKKQAENAVGKVGSNIPRVLQVPISKTGLYRLLRVEDESKIEVQRRISDTLVVKCPSASVKTVPEDKCLGDLSNFFFQVDATPPLKIKYSRRINSGESSHVSLNIHPDNLDSPLSRHGKSQTLIRYNPATSPDMQWARTQHIEIPVNETLGSSGTWAYSVDEIQDALGNVVIYSDSEDSVLQKQLRKELAQLFTVHELPGAQFTQCNLEAPLKVARGKAVNLPIALSGAGRSDASRYHITYTYHPEPGMAADGDVALVKQEEVILKGNSQGIKTSEPGLYGLKSVRSDYCAGEIKEPSSCLLQNPPEPDLTITSETIPDKCAGNSIGLLVDIDFIGTPPFTLTYNTRKAGGALTSTVKKFNQMRTQLELRPKEAGLYTYEFMEIHDSVYESRSLKHKNLVFEQDVRPPASAHFENLKSHKQACIKERSTFSVRLFGVKPWTLEYELLHGKNRKKYKIDDIQEEPYTLITDVLEEGGEYHLSITSVTDNSGCKVLLDNDARIDVRHHRPEAAFGRLSGKRIKTALEGKTVALPVKLTGDPPWTLTYTKVGDPSETVVKLRNANDNIDVVTPGLYQLTKVHDRECPGTVDSTSSQFEVSWVERPSVELAETPEGTTQDGTVIKKAVCEGDQDAMELSFTGNPPFVVKYEVHIKPKRGSASLSRRKETAGLNKASIKMETSQAGSVEYKFTELGDEHYESDRRKFKPLKFLQTIHNRPSATFKDIGKSYSYCKEDEAGDEVIPVLLTGTPPFSLEIGIKRHSTAKPQIVPISNIMSNTYNFRIPRTVLDLGTHAITIFKVQDAQGCQRVTEFDSPSVQVNVVDIPGISPLEPATDFCVGDRISFMLAGSAPFNVYYTFNGKEQKAASSTTTFRRIAEKPGEFTITGISDKASTDSCRARVGITKVIHPMPSVRISKGSTAQVDIHEGGEAELTFDFAGTPPFEFTLVTSPPYVDLC